MSMSRSDGSSHTLSIVAQLMAYAARADGSVSSEELSSLQSFLQRRYSDTERAELFSQFRSAVAERPAIEEIVSQAQGEFTTYRDRLELFTSVFGLLLTGGITIAESSVLDRIAAFLDIDPRDADLIRHATSDRSFEYPINIERFLLLAEESNMPDIPVEGFDLLLMELGDEYVAWSVSKSILLDGHERLPGEFVFIRDGSHIEIGDKSLFHKDIERLFELSKGEVSRRLELAQAPGALARSIDSGSPVLGISIEGPRIRIESISPGLGLLVNGRTISGKSELVLPGAMLRLPNHGIIGINEILDQLDGDHWPLSNEETDQFRYVISSRRSSGRIHRLKLPQRDTHIEILSDEMAPERFVLRVEAAGEARLDGAPLRDDSIEEVAKEALLKIGPDRFRLDPVRSKVTHSSSYVESLEASDLGFRFGKVWGLRHISFRAEAGDLVALMGASGSGKSTLLNLLIGQAKPYEGRVLLNGKDFFETLDRCRPLLGYVPQDDLLMDNLTIEENLYYAGRLRMPHLSEAELKERVNRVLRDIGLFDKRRLQVGSPTRKVLSGGQRKRLNIGVELLADPDLFYLDEPTSGLSSRDSESIVFLLKELTRKGKLVLVVIHQPSSNIFRMFDRLLVLDQGGVQAWYGPALDALEHFRSYLPGKRGFVECPACNSVNPEILFESIEQATGEGRRYDGIFWNNVYNLKRGTEAPAVREPSMDLPPPPRRRIAEKFASFQAGLARALIDRIRDKGNLMMSVLAPLLLGFIMSAMMLGDTVPYTWSGNTNLQKYFFLSVIIFSFFGLMASVGEIIRDRPILRREKVVHFSSAQYVLYKTLAYAPFAIAQSAIYTVGSALVLRMPWMPPAWIPLSPGLPFPVYFGITAFAVIQASYALGLLASSFLKTQAAAFNLIPLIIIPQILLGGVFVEYSSMPKILNRVVPEYAQISFSRWGYEALVAGESALNPVMCVQPKAVLSYRTKLEAQGGSFDYMRDIEEPVQRWRVQSAFSLPPERISKAVFKDTILQKLKDHDRSEDAVLIEASYKLAENGLVYELAPGVSEATRRAISAILLSKDAAFWASAYSAWSPNLALAEERTKALSDEGKKGLKGARAWFIDWSDYPSERKTINGGSYPTMVYDLLALVLMSLVCHAISVLRLKSKKI